MCGIAGIINKEGIDLLSLRRMTDKVRHRGPDDEGYFLTDSRDNIFIAGGKDTPEAVWSFISPYQPAFSISDFAGNKIQVGFGHRRLSILDLSPAGHQPMCFDKGRFWIILNGEIYNYIEIRSELSAKGYRFISNSDTEVVLAAWQEWGIQCQHHFNGMWAFVIYDRVEEVIFMSRDRFGIKPLYYWFAPDGSFCFASEIKQFTGVNGWNAGLNPQRVYDYLVYSFTDHTEETMFTGVHQIPPGYCFKSDIKSILPSTSGKLEVTKWYDLVRNPFQGTFEQASLRFEELFRSAINLHLRADVPVGSALSGGLDSSAIVCEVNSRLREQGVEFLQKTFSSCATDERYNEKKWMDVVVNHTNVDAFYIYPEWKDIFRLTSDLIWYHDEPYQSQSVFLGYHVFKLAKDNNVIVLLNGQGADEYLGGYGQFIDARLKKMVRQLALKKLFNEIVKPGNFTPYYSSHIFRTILSSVVPVSLKSMLSRTFSPNIRIRRLIDHQKLGASEKSPNEYIPVGLDTVQDISVHGLFYSTLPKYLKWEDRNSMANSIEARVPFLDYRLVEFAYNLPEDYIDYKGETKRILRQGLSNILPEEIKNRKDKKGFITPEERWVKQDNPRIFREKLAQAIESAGGIIKPDARKYFEQIITGKLPFDYTYWRLILFAEWIERFGLRLNQ